MAIIYEIDWGPIATLVTGILAVGAALFVGVRQTRIADQQREILKRQVVLAEMKLRSDLFDRRFAIYQATKDLLLHIIQKADVVSNKVEHEFRLSLDQAELIFLPEVMSGLEGIWADYCRFGAVRSAMISNFAQTGAYGQEEIEEKQQLLRKFNFMLMHLAQIFGHELQLSRLNRVDFSDGS